MEDRNYRLVDIHIHSNLSYDAFENDGGPLFSLDDYLSKLEETIDLGVITDHNIFDYKRHNEITTRLSNSQLKILPGVEVNISGVHWILILDDTDSVKLESFSRNLASIFNYDIDNYNISDLKKASQICTTPIKIIEILNSAKLEFIAIPHLEKHKGIWKESKKNNKMDDEVIDLFREGIIFGFESKRYENFFSDKISQTNANILSHDDIENVSRKEHLEFLYDCVKKIGNSAIIYGSDFHCKKGEFLSSYDHYVQRLFFIKSENSYRGIKFALLDSFSRVFSFERKKKFTKRDDYQINYISLSINNVKKDIYLGDGLNSIIGVKGSGKSFLLSMMLDDISKYNSGIQNQVKLNKIVFSNGKEYLHLDETQFTAILQKSDTNLYDMLSDAPYNTGKLIDLVKEMFVGKGHDTKNNTLKIYISCLNECVDSFLEKQKLINSKNDFNYSESYNSYYLAKEFDSRFFTQLNELKDTLEVQISKKKSNIIEIDKLNTKFYDFVNGFDALLDNSDFSKHMKLQSFDEKILSFKGDYLDIESSFKQKQTSIVKRFENTKRFVDKLHNSIYNKLGNQDRFFEQKNSILKDFIVNSLKTLINIEKSTLKVRKFHEKGMVENTRSYEIKQDAIDMVVIDKKELDFNHINKYVSEIIGNYNTNISTSYKDMFNEYDFGELYLEKVYPNKDRRKTTGSLSGYGFKTPDIKTNILLRNSSGEYDLDKMSPGERSDLIIDMVLSTKSYKILILDQPEDDLDNETVFKKLVTRIRELKLHRQIIMVTHNGNLCINSDSDKILVCEKSEEEYNVISDSMESNVKHRYHNLNGDESDLSVLNIASKILEGGNKALGMRLKKIGYHELITGKEE